MAHLADWINATQPNYRKLRLHSVLDRPQSNCVEAVFSHKGMFDLNPQFEND